MTARASDQPTFTDLVFSDYERYRPGSRASWPKVLLRLPSLPGLLASLVLRAQQRLFERGHGRAAGLLRTLGNTLVGADFVVGFKVGRGFMLVHPVGVVIGSGAVIGDDVSFAGGVTCAGRHFEDVPGQVQEFPTIGDGAVIGAHAVLIGGVTVGDRAVVGANSVVLSDVPADAVVVGSPARRVGTRGETGHTRRIHSDDGGLGSAATGT